MKKILILISLLYVSSFNFAFGVIYYADEKQALADISKYYNVSVENLKKLNELQGDYIEKGSELYIPHEVVEYTVHSGDTLAMLATQFGSFVSSIVIYNNLAGESIHEGDSIKIPVIQGNEVTAIEAPLPIVNNNVDPSNPTGVGIQKDNEKEDVKVNSIPVQNSLYKFTKNYKVEKGDNLSSIALKFHVSAKDIKTWNKKTSDTLFINETLVLHSNHPLDENIKSFSYTVAAGDNLSTIANKFHINVEDIKTWNKKTNDTLFIGETLTLYAKKEVIPHKSDEKPLIYHVKLDDNLSSIALKFHVSVNDLKLWNNKTSDTVFINEQLKIYASQTKLTPKSSKKPFTYIVQKGDNLSSIALKFKVNVSDIQDWNNKSNTSYLFVGEKLVIYSDTDPETIPKNGSIKKTYTVKKGDNLSNIASYYGLTTYQIKKWNNKKTDTLFTNEKLTLYVDKTIPDKGEKKVYTVKKGDDLSTIAYNYGVKVNDLKNWNNKTSNILQVGEKLTIYSDKNVANKINNSKTIDKKSYTVKKGDTLYKIAKAANTSVENIKNWNHKKTSTLKVGEKLVLYGNKVDSISTQTVSKYTIPNSSSKIQNTPKKSNSSVSKASIKKLEMTHFPVDTSLIKQVSPMNRGIELTLSKASYVYSTVTGKVQYSGYMKMFGHVVIVETEDKDEVVYGYLGSTAVKTNDYVKEHDIIGVVSYNNYHNKVRLYLEARNKNQVLDLFSIYPKLEIDSLTAKK